MQLAGCQQRVDQLSAVVHERVAEDADDARFRVDLDDTRRRRVGPGRVGVEAAVPLRGVVDVPDLEVAHRLEPGLDAVHVLAVRMQVDLRDRVLEADRPVGRPAHVEPAVLRLDVLRTRLEHARRDPHQLFPDVPRGEQRRRAAEDDAARAVVSGADRAEVSVSLDDADALQLAAEGVGDDLRDPRLVAAARRRHPGQHDDLARRRHPHLCRVAPGEQASGHRESLRGQLVADPETDEATLLPGGSLLCPEVLVPHQVERLAQRPLVVAAVDDRAVHLRERELVLVDEVARPDLVAREARGARDVIHDPVHEEGRRVLAEAPVRLPEALVRDDCLELGDDVLDLVGARDADPGDERHPPAGDRRLDPHVREQLDAESGHLSVSGVRGLVVAARVARVPGGGEVLVALLDPAHRALQPPREVRDQDVLVEGRPLAAEGAADLGLDHTDRRLGQPQRLREVVAQRVRRLRGVPAGERALAAVPGGDDTPRLERSGHDPRRAQRASDDPVGFRERALDVARLRPLLDHDVVAP